MVAITELLNRSKNKPFVLLDFSPPKGGVDLLIEDSLTLTPDVFSVAYNPGKSVRMNSIFAASWIQKHTELTSVFTISTRDMNKLALQSLILGAQLYGLDNIIIVKGDSFSKNESLSQNPVDDFTPTEFISSVKQMNQRRDFQGRDLQYPTGFCVGGSFDTSKNLDLEIKLLNHKIKSGIDFIISQPIFDLDVVSRVYDKYEKCFGEKLSIPILWGLQMIDKYSLSFVDVPDSIVKDIELGKSSIDIAVELFDEYQSNGINNIYLIPPFYKGGRRDYQVAQTFIESVS
jgi:5,10-methylenetetrahydrofolate reductase